MSLEIGPDLSPTFSFDRETSSGEKLITFKDNLNARTDFDQLSKLLETLLDEEEKKLLQETSSKGYYHGRLGESG